MDVCVMAEQTAPDRTGTGMDEITLAYIGMKTYRFVRRVMQDPETRAKIQARAEELRQEGGVA